MNPLDNLKDIHIPEQVDVWPLAAGWWVALGLLVALVAGLVWVVVRALNKRRGKRAALRQLAELRQQGTPTPLQLNALLKQTALYYFDKQAVAALHGSAWTQFLNAQLPAKYQTQFASDCQQLQLSLYSQHAATDPQPLLAATELWLKQALPPTTAAKSVDSTPTMESQGV